MPPASVAPEHHRVLGDVGFDPTWVAFSRLSRGGGIPPGKTNKQTKEPTGKARGTVSQIRASSFSPTSRLFWTKGARKAFPKRGGHHLWMPRVGDRVFLQPGWSKASCRFALVLCFCAYPAPWCYSEASLSVGLSPRSVLHCQMSPALTPPQRVLRPPSARDLSAWAPSCRGMISRSWWDARGSRDLF